MHLEIRWLGFALGYTVGPEQGNTLTYTFGDTVVPALGETVRPALCGTVGSACVILWELYLASDMV